MTQHPITTRIRARLAELEWTQNHFFERAGVGASFIKNLDQGRARSPKLDTLLRVAQTLGVTLEWLIHGEDAPDNVPDPAGAQITVTDPPQTPPGATRVRELDVRLSAGDGAVGGSERVRRSWWIPTSVLDWLGVRPDDAVLLEVTGHSMAPQLYDGDLVMIDRAADRVTGGAIYAVWDGSALVVKRVSLQGEALLLASDNAQHAPYTVPAADARLLGRVIWAARRLR